MAIVQVLIPINNDLPHSTTAAEDIIASQIAGIQKMIKVRDDIPEEELGIHINPAMKRHFELEIKILREAPRDADKLRMLLKAERVEWEDTMKIGELERLVTEIEMLKFVLCLVCKNGIKNK